MSSFGGGVLLLIFGFSVFFVAHVQGIECYQCDTILPDDTTNTPCNGDDKSTWRKKTCPGGKCQIKTVNFEKDGKKTNFQRRSCEDSKAVYIPGCQKMGAIPFTKWILGETCMCDKDLCNGYDRPTAPTEKPGKKSDGSVGNGKSGGKSDGSVGSDASTILLGGLGKGFFILIGTLFFLLGLE